jgi:hypothetical protein
VPTSDFDDERDRQFEGYLKQFHPLAIEPLPIERSRRVIRHRSVLAMVGAAAAILLAAVFLHFRAGRIDRLEAVAGRGSDERLARSQLLTMSSANALLASTPSFDEAVEEMAFPPQTTPLPRDQYSALAVLSEERIKP